MQVWQQAKALAPAQGDGLTLDQFAVALRLVALVQVTPGCLQACLALSSMRCRHVTALIGSRSVVQPCML